MKNISSKNSQRGAVSIFVVIFAALLITIVTVSFIRIMVNDQNQAINNDLSQSAYDSAQAGVEDAKRALLRYQSVCQTQGTAACELLAQQLSTDDCNQALRVGDVVPSNGDVTSEVPIQQSTNTNDDILDQAYTCVTIDIETPDYIGSLSANQSKLIPLIGKAGDGSTTFDRVTLEWFSLEDIASGSGTEVSLYRVSETPLPLREQSSWPANRPAMMRASLMQHGTSFTLEDFDYSNGASSNGNTLFLYPTSPNASSTHPFSRDSRRGTSTENTPADIAADTPLGVQCQSSLSAGGYSCRTTLLLPEPINGGERTAYLRLTALYNASHYRVTLANVATDVNFNGVQPEIDSTGRANDLFRRVVSRVDLVDTNFPLPNGALELSGNLCKDFSVTDTAYIPANSSGATCQP
jgi:Tfp pilus assembly protein PilX